MKIAKGVVAVGLMAMMGSFSGAAFGSGEYLYCALDLAAAGYWGFLAYINLEARP